MTVRLVRAAAAAGAALLLLAACTPSQQASGSPAAAGSGSSATQHPGSGSASKDLAGDPCSLITGAEVSQVMGRPFPQPTAANVGTELACQTQDQAVTVSWGIVQQGESQGTFSTVESYYPGAHDIPGLGAKAYCAANTGLIYSVHVLKGTTELDVNADTCAHAEPLVKIAAGRLSP